jgi:NTE family protein
MVSNREMKLGDRTRSLWNRLLRRPGRIGLALGSGGARGCAHIGVIRALQEAGLPIACVAGTSMGSLVGAVFASGRLDSLREVARGMDWRQVLYYFAEASLLPKAGLIDGRRIVAFVRRYVALETIEQLPLPFAACATDVMTGEEIVLDRGDIMDAVRASISIPGIFAPVRRAGRTLVDGGLVNPVPVNLARALGADTVIAVDVNHLAEPLPTRRPVPARRAASAQEEPARRTPEAILADIRTALAGFSWPTRRRAKTDGPDLSIFDVIGNSIRIMEAQVTETRLKVEPPDLLIRPRLRDVSTLDFHKADAIMDEGYTAARAVLATAS